MLVRQILTEDYAQRLCGPPLPPLPLGLESLLAPDLAHGRAAQILQAEAGRGGEDGRRVLGRARYGETLRRLEY